MKRAKPISAEKAWAAFAWAMSVILALGIGIYAGAKVTAANKDVELMDVEAERDAARDDLADAIKERDFWRWTLKGLAEGGQLEGVDLKGRPSTGD
jgi:uncharacterized protein HemX